jgi:GNAT superfamily N-acetyltransferase
LEAPSEQDLGAVASLFSDFWREVIPGEPDFPVAELVSEIQEAPAHHRVLFATVHEHGEVIAGAQLNLDDIEGQRSHAWVPYLVVRPDCRERGIGSALLHALADRARGEGRVRLDTAAAVSHQGGMVFASAIGATAGLVDRQNRVPTERLDRVLLDGWVQRSSYRAGDYCLICFDGRCPEEWLVPFAEVTSIMNTAPRADGVDDVIVTPEQIQANQEARLRRRGWSWTVCACHRPTRRLVGFTEVGGFSYRPWLAEQGDTGVHPAHRNRGLGRWMKAVNASRLLDEKPEVGVLETWNAGVNAPMLSINEAMGFQAVAEWQEWRFPIASG